LLLLVVVVPLCLICHPFELAFASGIVQATEAKNKKKASRCKKTRHQIQVHVRRISKTQKRPAFSQGSAERSPQPVKESRASLALCGGTRG
jgi:hypothetical protein